MMPLLLLAVGQLSTTCTKCS